VPVLPSMTGVAVMPTSGTMSVVRVTADGTVVMPADGLMKLSFQSGAPPVSASKAYTLSCSVVTNTTLCVPLPGMGTFDTVSGWP
jgi:hypothetical protein